MDPRSNIARTLLPLVVTLGIGAALVGTVVLVDARQKRAAKREAECQTIELAELRHRDGDSPRALTPAQRDWFDANCRTDCERLEAAEYRGEQIRPSEITWFREHCLPSHRR